ncbi:rod shape-determining protein MreD [Pseudooceanicola sp. HF7]|uniref:rod shape-determining protein MreD n=1 Tax=Pseudooceanicola sp. HF7 TaxID=2721560 RepID=UPI001430F943|nr:rod shape-determining protein MreD [Pseudooceanicola sp. HF7]NIZ10257.1 rod shape-determining protein MreD [Pseudooceanicola sp. HF7]
MAEAIRSSLPRVLSLRLAFVLIYLGLMMFSLLPLETLPRLLAGPDLMLALTLVWAIRRPELVPGWMLAALFLLADLLLMRPPGLMAAIALLGVQRLKRYSRLMRDRTFVAEWLAAGITCAAILIGYRLALITFFLDRPQIAVTLSQLIATVAVYPFVSVFSNLFFGLRRAAVGEVDNLGHRI